MRFDILRKLKIFAHNTVGSLWFGFFSLVTFGLVGFGLSDILHLHHRVSPDTVRKKVFFCMSFQFCLWPFVLDQKVGIGFFVFFPLGVCVSVCVLGLGCVRCLIITMKWVMEKKLSEEENPFVTRHVTTFFSLNFFILHSLM